LLSESPDEDLDSDGEEEDDPDLLIPSSSYESLVCGACVLASPFLSLHAGTPGACMTAWSIQNNSWIVLGCPAEEGVDQKFGEQAEVAVDDGMVSHLGSSERSYASLGTKRHLSPDIERNGTLVKRQKCETSPPSWECPPDPSKAEASTSCSRPSPNPVAQALVQRRKIRGSITEASVEPMEDLGECDLFLSEGFRLRWCRCSTCASMLEWEKNHPRYRYLFEEEPELYEPPEDPDSGASLEELGMRVLDKLPRDKTIDGIQAYNTMRDELIEYLRPFAESGRVVGENDMKAFFDEKREKLAAHS